MVTIKMKQTVKKRKRKTPKGINLAAVFWCELELRNSDKLTTTVYKIGVIELRTKPVLYQRFLLKNI